MSWLCKGFEFLGFLQMHKILKKVRGSSSFALLPLVPIVIFLLTPMACLFI